MRLKDSRTGIHAELRIPARTIAYSCTIAAAAHACSRTMRPLAQPLPRRGTDACAFPEPHASRTHLAGQPPARPNSWRVAATERLREPSAAATPLAVQSLAALGAQETGSPADKRLGTPDSVVQLAERVRRKPGGTQPAERRKSRRQLAPEARGRTLSASNLLAFERLGHLTTRGLLSQEEVERIKTVLEAEVAQRRLQALQHRVRVLCSGSPTRSPQTVEEAERLLAAENIQPVGFLQFFNTWRTNEAVRRLITHGALPRTAAALLGRKKLRVYQDCAFLKEPGHGPTNWHCDLRMAPFDTNAYVTAWLPLRRIRPLQDSGLRYASGSHRDVALPFWRGPRLNSLDLSNRGYSLAGTGALEVGDVAWHHGWLLHTAGGQPPGSQPRLALSVSYFADGARTLPRRLASRVQDEDAESYAAWLGEIEPGAAAEHELLPLVDCT